MTLAEKINDKLVVNKNENFKNKSSRVSWMPLSPSPIIETVTENIIVNADLIEKNGNFNFTYYCSEMIKPNEVELLKNSKTKLDYEIFQNESNEKIKM